MSTITTSRLTPASLAAGIDVGGTFTDLAAIAPDGTVHTSKVLSTPLDRAAGVLAALDASAIDGSVLAYIAHGTTVVTNLLLERRGARVVVCATEGFTDLLELRRQERAGLYDLTRHHTAPLVAAVDVVPVRERMVPSGVLVPLIDTTIASVVDDVVARKGDIVVIALLHAYAWPVHEQQLADALRARFAAEGIDCDVVCSHVVLPEIREYERTATSVAEAYARPAVRRYLATLADRLTARGYPAPRVMTSAGGTLSSAEAAHHAASLALSGPAGGVTGAAAVARALGIDHALTIDIGGTSADVGLIVHGDPLVERGGDVAGVPIALPRVLVEAVAAGGGSLGWVDAGGALRAGPESAGASPGPACYGRGGLRPTVTDAHVVLGHIPAGRWSGGVSIDAARAREAMGHIADAMHVSVERAAEALIATADATMARALRRVSVERGVNPRDATLIAFGGGGPLHACGLADRLGMRRVVVPPHAGVLSAVGLALAPERRERVSSLVMETAALDVSMLATRLQHEASALDDAMAPARTVRWWVRARYVGQGYELDVPVAAGDSGADIATRFVERHVQRTGFALDRAVECISLRTTVGGAPWPVQFARPARDGAVPEGAVPEGAVPEGAVPEGAVPEGAVPEGAVPDDADDGYALTRTRNGPAVVRLPDATLFIAPGWTAQTLAIGGWSLERQ